MGSNDVGVVLVHGAWADGSSRAKVIGPLAAGGVSVVAAPRPCNARSRPPASPSPWIGRGGRMCRPGSWLPSRIA